MLLYELIENVCHLSHTQPTKMKNQAKTKRDSITENNYFNDIQLRMVYFIGKHEAFLVHTYYYYIVFYLRFVYDVCAPTNSMKPTRKHVKEEK